MRSIPEKESLEVEFKSDVKKLHDGSLIDAVSGLANTLGGSLYLGVEDDGTVTGVHPDHSVPLKMNGLIASRTVPALAVSSELVDEDGIDVLHILVPHSHFPVETSDGRILHRILAPNGTPQNVPMRLFEAIDHLSGVYDFDYTAQILEDLTADDIDTVQIQRLRNMVEKWHGDQALLELDDEELLKSLGMIQPDLQTQKYHPTTAGILLAGKAKILKERFPTSATAFQVLDDINVRVNDIQILPILEAFEKLLTQIEAYNPEDDKMNGPLRQGIRTFSPLAVREALINALSHRDYTIMREIHVQITKDGLSISSPGGFQNGVTLENMLTVSPHPRNPLLADILKRIGLSERTGRGIDTIFKETISTGRPAPDYSDSTKQDVKVFFVRQKPDFDYINRIREKQQVLHEKFTLNELLVLTVLRNWKRRSFEQIIDESHMNRSILRKCLNTLYSLELISIEGEDEEARYSYQSTDAASSLNPEQPDAADKKVAVNSISDVKLAPEDQILNWLDANPSITRREAEELLQLSTSSTLSFLKKMIKDGKIIQKGTSRSTVYVRA